MRISLFVSGLIILLFFGVFEDALAATCKYIGDPPPVENTNDCDFSVLITDPGGAELDICRYKIVTAGGNPGDPAFWNSDWNNPQSCAGDFATMTKTIQIPESFSAGDYDIHWYAKDHSNNTAQGLFDTFRVVTLPTVSTQAATNVSGTQATLNGTLESLGGASNVTVWFEWGTSISYGSSTTPVTKTSTGPFSASLSNLIGGTTYHFRAVAQYAGTEYGADQQFTTSDIIAPEYQSFRINNVFCDGDSCPATVIVTSGPLNITWGASDSGGSGVNRHELWRAPDAGGSPGSWGPVPGKDNFPPAATSTTDTPPNNGTWWYGMHTVDNANNCITERKTFCPGGVQSDNVTRTAHGPIKVIFGDQIAPTVSADNASSQWFQSRDVTLSVSDTGGSGLPANPGRYSWDTNNFNAACTTGGNGSYNNNDKISVPQGSHRLYLCARDNAGNVGNWDSGADQYRVDATAPTIGSFSVSPSGWTNWNITVSFAASDSDSGIQEIEVYRASDNNGTPGTWDNIKDNASSPFLDSPSDGIYWYGIHVVDGAGNCVVESGQNCTPPPSGAPQKAQVDKTPPNPPNPLISPQNNSTVTTENPTYTWNASSDSGSGVASYHIQADNNQQFNNTEDDRFVSSTTYNSVPNLFHAGYYWHVSAKDNAGNEGSFSPSWFFYIQLNQPPNASFNCTPANCTVYNITETLTFNNNSSDPDNNISQSQWDILNWGSIPDTACGGLCNHTLQPGISPNTYTMQLTVIDSAGASDTDTRSFTVKQDIVAGFMCSLDNVNFVACTSLSGQISQGEALYLKDSSSLSEYTIVSQGASSVNSRTWKINGSTFSSGNNANPSTTIPSQGIVTLDLDARDNQGRSDTQTHTLNPQLPFPEFQEISPF